jgi:hypothetical protein
MHMKMHMHTSHMHIPYTYAYTDAPRTLAERLRGWQWAFGLRNQQDFLLRLGVPAHDHEGWVLAGRAPLAREGLGVAFARPLLALPSARRAATSAYITRHLLSVKN